MSVLSLEERVAALESKIEQLQQQIPGKSSEEPQGWQKISSGYLATAPTLMRWCALGKNGVPLKMRLRTRIVFDEDFV